ncbi:MAG TPA: DUF1844 domain-containing protein [Candidatus Binataceae bacterium]
MAEGDEKSKGFKVDDRRRFSAEGEARPEATSRPDVESKPERQAQAGAGKPETGNKPDAATAAQPSESQPRSSAAAPDAGASPHGSPYPEAEVNFVTFVVGLSTQALAALGEMPDPATGESLRDLKAAQQLIDIIGILRDKTRGNLEREEESLLEAILFDLRMKYVELARQPGR